MAPDDRPQRPVRLLVGMYGLIGRFVCEPGTRRQLAEILGSIGAMPGCLSYVVALDAEHEDGVWVTEVWTDEAAHAASLELARVQAAIAACRRYITGMDVRYETRPVGGFGLDTVTASS